MDKLTVINRALTNTGNNRVNVLHDPSDEGVTTETTFDRAIKLLVARHSWPFATSIQDLVRVPNTENQSERYPDNAYRMPPNALHLEEVFYCGRQVTEYEIMGTLISCPYDRDISAAVVSMPPDAIWHPMAEEILTMYVEAGCLRSLNEDFKEANNVDIRIEALLLEARPRVGQQDAARDVYVSSIHKARRTRRA